MLFGIKKKKGISIAISYVLVSTIILISAVLAYNLGMPTIEDYKKNMEANNALVFLTDVREAIQQLEIEGNGSQRTRSFFFSKGELLVGNETLQYHIEDVCMSGTEYVSSACNGGLILALKNENFRIEGSIRASGGELKLKNTGYDNKTIISVRVN